MGPVINLDSVYVRRVGLEHCVIFQSAEKDAMNKMDIAGGSALE